MLDENFNRIVELIEQRKNNAYIKINEELILMYLDVGKFLHDLQQKSKYGDKITTKAAEFMKNNHPNVKGFNKRNNSVKFNQWLCAGWGDSVFFGHPAGKSWSVRPLDKRTGHEQKRERNQSAQAQCVVCCFWKGDGNRWLRLLFGEHQNRNGSFVNSSKLTRTSPEQ